MKNNIDTKRILSTLFTLHHKVMITITEEEGLGTVGEEFKNNIDVAESSANVLSLKISKKDA